jgi:O-antigen/teichoic acid export membrane protein
MDKALNMGKVSATGSFQLFIGKVLSTLILAAGAIIVGIFISDIDYGLYTIALIPASTFLLFQSWGVSSAMVKYCAHYRATDQKENLRRLIVAGLTFEVATGLALTVMSLLTANFIASSIFGQPDSAFLIALASLVILSTSLMAPAQSIFVGFERMDLNSFTMVCQAVTYFMIPLLVFLGYGALGAVVGYTFSLLATGIIAITMLYFVIFRKLDPGKNSNSSLSQTLKPLLHYGFPIAVASILGGILLQFYSFMMGAFCDLALIGNYRIATNFAVLLTFFTIPISTVLFPAFSKLDAKKEPQLLKTVFTSSVKYTALLLVPATLALMVLSQPIISTIYAGKWPHAPSFLTLYVISNLFSIFGNLSLGSFLTGLGETKLLMELNILTLCIGIPFAFILIPALEIVGVILCILIAGVPSMFIGLHRIWKRYGVKADLSSSAKIFLASAIATIATYLFLTFFNAAAWLTLTGGVIIFLAISLIAAPLIGAINQTDINNLRAMFSGLGIISKLLEIPLTLMEKPLKIHLQRPKAGE